MENLHWYYSQLTRLGGAYLDRHLEKYALNHSYSSYIIYICRTEEIRQDHLSEVFGVNRSSVKRAVEHLEKHGYVTREQYEGDRRKYRLYPTQKAFDMVDEIFRLKGEWDQIVLGDLAESDREYIFKHMREMTENAKEYIRELRHSVE